MFPLVAGAGLLVGGGLFAAHGDYLPLGVPELAWAAPGVLTAAGAFGLLAGSALFATGALRLLGRSVVRPGTGGDLSLPFVAATLALSIASTLVFVGTGRARDARELSERGRETWGAIVDREMARRGRGGPREERIRFVYAAGDTLLHGDAWADDVEVHGGTQVRLRYSERYPHVHRVE